MRPCELLFGEKPMKFKHIFIAVVVAVAAVGYGSSPASYGSTPASIAFNKVMGPAILKAELALRALNKNFPANATDAQRQQLHAREGAILARLKSTLLKKKKLSAIFTVTNVLADNPKGKFEVEGTIKWHQPAVRSRAVRQAIATINKTYESTMETISENSYSGYADPREGRSQDVQAAAEVRRTELQGIASEIAPPPQQIFVRDADHGVLAWKKGQVQTVFGRVTSVEVGPVSIGDYAHTQGDYVACTIRMRWIAAHAPQAAKEPAVPKRPSSPAEFQIMLKGGSKIHVTSCAKHGQRERRS